MVIGDGQVVAPGDPRLGLVGQRAVRVKRAATSENFARTTSSASVEGTTVIPSGSVLLHYAGTVHTKREFEDRYDFQQR